MDLVIDVTLSRADYQADGLRVTDALSDRFPEALIFVQGADGITPHVKLDWCGVTVSPSTDDMTIARALETIEDVLTVSVVL